MSWRTAFGIASIALGVVLALRPFTTLAVLVGLTALAFITAAYVLVAPNGVRSRAHRDRRSHTPEIPSLFHRLEASLPTWVEESRAAHLTAGFVFAAAGVGVVAWPHITYVAFAYLPLFALLFYGIFTLGRFAFSARTHTPGAKELTARPLLLGPAAVLLAFAGWRWPDVILMALALSTGVALVVYGVRLLHRRKPARRPGRHPGWRRWAVAAAVPASIGALVLSGYLGTHPDPDYFYTPPEATRPAAEPGTLLSAEAHPAPSGARAERILYTTRTSRGAPAVASAVVYTPQNTQNAPVVAWAHTTTGIAPGCAPSIAGMDAGAMHVLPEILAAGWATVVTDYTGATANGAHPYLLGTGEGRSIIDSVRAAHHASSSLGRETVLWGHSQGGHGALWAGGIWQDYAPELPLLGVAAFAPAANLPAIFDSWAENKFMNAFSSYTVSAYAREYDDVEARDHVRPGAYATGAAYASKCLDSPGTAVTLTASLLQETSIMKNARVEGALRERAEQNTPTLGISAPLLILQGEHDAVISPRHQADYVAKRCGAGWELDYRTYPGLDHLPLVEQGSPAIDDAFLWTATLFGGATVPESTC